MKFTLDQHRSKPQTEVAELPDYERLYNGMRGHYVKVKDELAKLQAEVKTAEAVAHRTNEKLSESTKQVAKLQAVFDAAKDLLANVKRGTPVDLVAVEQQRDIADILEQAIKEVE